MFGPTWVSGHSSMNSVMFVYSQSPYFRYRRQLLFQNDLACFIQNTAERPVVSQIQTDRQLLFLEKFALKFLNNASLLHKLVSFLLRFSEGGQLILYAGRDFGEQLPCD